MSGTGTKVTKYTGIQKPVEKREAEVISSGGGIKLKRLQAILSICRL